MCLKAVDITRDNNNNQGVNQEDIMIIHVCTAKKRSPKYKKQTLIRPEGGKDKTSLVIVLS